MNSDLCYIVSGGVGILCSIIICSILGYYNSQFCNVIKRLYKKFKTKSLVIKIISVYFILYVPFIIGISIFAPNTERKVIYIFNSLLISFFFPVFVCISWFDFFILNLLFGKQLHFVKCKINYLWRRIKACIKSLVEKEFVQEFFAILLSYGVFSAIVLKITNSLLLLIYGFVTFIILVLVGSKIYPLIEKVLKKILKKYYESFNVILSISYIVIAFVLSISICKEISNYHYKEKFGFVSEKFVYITPYGHCYHYTLHCGEIKKKYLKISLKEANEDGYVLCKKCADR